MSEKLFKAQIENIPPIAAKASASAGLGDKIENVFTRFVQSVMHWGWDFVGELFVNIFDYSMKILKPGMMRMFMPYLNKVKNMRGLPDDIRELIARVESEQGEAGAVGVGLLAMVVLYQLIGAAVQPLAQEITHVVNKVVKPIAATPELAAMMYSRGEIEIEMLQEWMKINGISDESVSYYLEANKNHPSINDNIEFLRRGLISAEEFDKKLMSLQIKPSDREKYKALAFYTPPVNDLIRFMVRDAFNNEAINKYGYDEDYPAAINKYLPLVGLSPDWGNKYWRAHWQLPSPSQAYEMLHRNIIDNDTLAELLKISDYPVYWRDKLIKMSYNVLTRVDVRRLLQSGIITYEKALNSYLEMGYKPDDAKLLADFAAKGITQDERDLTRTDIINMYEDALLDRGAAAGSLVKMGYDNDEAEDILKLADLNIVKANRTDAINYTKERYTANKIDRNAAANELAQAGVKQTGVDRYLLAWDRTLSSAEKIPSPSDAKRFYMGDYINEAQYREFMKLNGYSAANIDLYVKMVNDDKAAQNAQ